MIDFDWTARYPTYRSPVMARNVVATSHPLASQAGLRMLAKGGNAVDAIVAAAAALTIVEPVSNGLGSDNFAILWDGTALHGLNASGPAPAAWNPDYFARRHGGRIPTRGWDAVTVPGAVAGWVALSTRFGRLPFADLLEPAIELASRGHAVGVIVAHKWAAQVAELRALPGFADAFLPHGRAPHPSERFRFPDAATTLTRIAETGGDAFYRGDVAARLVAHARDHGGSLAAGDLADFAPEWVVPIEKDFAGHTVHELPPNGQGIAALMALGLVDRLGIDRFDVDSVASQHLQIEAMKLAFADVYRWVGDERHMTEVTVAHLLDDGYLDDRARLIDPSRATDFAHGTPARGGTVYLTAADERGMMVSLIQSNYMGFGSGVVVPGTGVSLQNRGHGFTLDPSHPNVVAGGKRPFHTIIPGFVTETVDGVRRPRMSFGVMGGNLQPQGHLQTLVRMLKYRQNPQAACDAPRWKVATGLAVDFESTMAPSLVAGLKAMGHRFEATDDSYMDYGSGQFIWKRSEDLDDGYVAASDSRRDGQAAGF